ncbi:hypothetical protein Cgig2_006345 [Carnegiea gigantea]|uniref:Uncharacterized protein n=1 Tax=Carnegiea gigantea TaxID=171969 RepID=A0A9Q1Q4U5_9CARY|nr:hypothetical protein Cgig2_006345 [Carnegiea gigantea]
MIKVENHLNCAEEVFEQRRREKMVRPRSNGVKTQQAISAVNGRRQSFPASAPPSAPGSTDGSDVGSGLDFTKEDIEALLNERMRTRNKFNYKERCEQMMDYIKRLRLGITWFQEVEGGHLSEQESLRALLESAEKKCTEMGNDQVMMQNKEEELNAIIMELRKNYNLLQEKCAKEESNKLAVMDDLSRETEARIAAEKLQASLLNDIEKAHLEQQVSSQKVG